MVNADTTEDCFVDKMWYAGMRNRRTAEPRTANRGTQRHDTWGDAMTEQTFGDWLRQRRRTLDLTKDALAEQVGCSPATIAKIEANLRRPSQQVALRLAAALAIPDAERAAFVRLSRGVREAPPVLPAPAPVHHHPALPMPLTPLIGREGVVQMVLEQLRGTRLLTLTGPPGVGKTRLALAVAERAAATFANDLAFVALAAVRDSGLVLDALAQALGIAPQAGVPPFERLVAALQTRRMLILLDNFEQVVAAAPLLAELLTRCPTITLLVTSRERLRLRGEQHIRVEALALPDLHQPLTTAQIVDAPAIQLFRTTAQAAQAGFQVSEESALTIAAICAALDGLPLAIELIASQADLLAPSALLAQIAQNRLGGVGLRDLPERQQTLQAALDWSYTLLPAHEQQLLRHLAVFSGTWSLTDAKAVCGGDIVGTSLTALINKSLVQQAVPVVSEAQFTLLATVRAYAHEQSDQRDETTDLYNRHAAYYQALAAEAAPYLTTGAQRLWIERLRAAHTNLLAALAWLLDQGQNEQAGMICRDLRRFWWLCGYWHEGRMWLQRVLADSPALTPLLYAHVQISAGMLATAQGDFSQAASAFEAALGLGQYHEDREVIGIAAQNLGSVMLSQGNYQRGRALFEVGLAIDRELGDTWGLAISLGSLAELAHDLGDYGTARTYYEESLAIFRQHEDHASIAIALNNVGEVLLRQGDLVAAHNHLTEALLLARQHQLARALPALRNNLCLVALAQGETLLAQNLLAEALPLLSDLGNLQDTATSVFVAAVFALEGQQYALAATLFGANHGLRSSHNLPLPPSDQAEFDGVVARTQGALAEAAFAEAWAIGQQYSLNESIAASRTVVAVPFMSV